MLRLQKSQFLIALSVLLFCVAVFASPTKLESQSEDEVALNNGTSELEFNCPKFCTCTMPVKAHTKFLHAQCNQTEGLLEESPLEPLYPIHSIDLSYLRLSRVSNILTKLTNLTSINLSHNELHEIGHLGRRIKRLNLKHNRITSNKLSKLPENLKVLNLQHNDISYLPLDFMRLNQLTHLELSHNHIDCTCDTLEVRDWLQRRHVFMENPVLCGNPVQVQGKSWLQVKQSQMCEHEKSVFFDDDHENSLISTDQPVQDVDNEDDELKHDFIPVMGKLLHARSVKDEEHVDFEGSGLNDEEAEVGSGSGDGEFLRIEIPTTKKIIINTPVEPGLKDDTPLEDPPRAFTASPDMFNKYNQNIFDENNMEEQPVEKEIVVPVEQSPEPIENVVTDAPITDNSKASDAIQHANVASKNDSNATYLLLGIIGLLVLGLLLFVAIKRCNKKGRAYDAEALRQTELLDMDNNKLGKPLQRNGTEHSPLIGEKTKIDQAKPINGSSKKPYDANDAKDGTGQQLLTENGKSAPVNGTQAETIIGAENQPHEYHPITPRYPTPKSPRASKYGAYPPEKNNNTSHDDAYLPSSPKSGRYSPVYSPETGRVKIKLTETPRPKTPMLVTRSRSNAGDIITTPVHLVKDTAEVNGGVH